MEFIKVTKKGNVKVAHEGGVVATAYFIPTGDCLSCALNNKGMCNLSPCTPGERSERGLPYSDGSFTWHKQ